MGVLLALTAAQLHRQGRVTWCACGGWAPWAGDIWSAHNSQHLFDPYSFTHVLHGLLFYGLLALLCPRLPFAWRLALVVGLEAGWEILENTAFVIRRYREATIGLGYEGDSIANSLVDILCCAGGAFLARRIGWRWSLALFLAVELLLLLWVRDNLTLNVLMLLFPLDPIKAWQMGGTP